MGLPAVTQTDLEKALFQDGLSTADEVTEYSGRGVGMGAVRAACAARGGHVAIASTSRGTTLLFKFPVAAMNPRCPIVRSKAA
jgi:two-component system chemotaxis sensor kinase CheA